MLNFAFDAFSRHAKSKYIFDQKGAHRKMTQIGVIGSSRIPTGSQLVTKTILAAKCRFAKFVISQAGNSETCRPPNVKHEIEKKDCGGVQLKYWLNMS